MDEKKEKTSAVGMNGELNGNVSTQTAEPQLSADFFAQLLHLPTCKTKGYCNNCGRCER